MKGQTARSKLISHFVNYISYNSLLYVIFIGVIRCAVQRIEALEATVSCQLITVFLLNAR